MTARAKNGRSADGKNLATLISPGLSVARFAFEDRDGLLVLRRYIHVLPIRAEDNPCGPEPAAFAPVADALEEFELARGVISPEAGDRARNGRDRVHVQAVGADGELVAPLETPEVALAVEE